MDYGDRVAAIEREAALLADALRAAPLTAPVPTCPEWTLRDLASHVGEFVGLWTHVLCEAGGVDKVPFTPLEEVNVDIGRWFEDLAADLIVRLRATSGDAPAWTWMPDHQTADAVARRCANELALHRYDAQSASGVTAPLDPSVARDAIDEIFVMLPAWGNPPDGSGLSLHAHGTDGGEWTITLSAEGPRVTHEHLRADLTLTGHASDLALLLFRRPTIGAVERAGDSAALDAWYRDFLFD